MGMLLGVLSRCSGVPRDSQEAQWVNLVTKKFVYSSDIVVGFENFEIGQKTKKLAPTAPDWGYPVDAQECAEVVKSAQWVNLVKKFLYIHQIFALISSRRNSKINDIQYCLFGE